uniref:RNA-dependent RNA polymerase n=1 Tax=Tonghua Narna tick virus 2 TaxID=2972241 RepID=A0A9E8AD51_9VIRU|nr:MAG: RNA-dependent RNA polymerase [Tonghua Narna tick virus 2]
MKVSALSGVFLHDFPTDDAARADDRSLSGQPYPGDKRKASGVAGKPHDQKCFGRKSEVTCRAAGKTKKQHRGCYPGGQSIQNLPSAPFWADPSPCPAIGSARHRQDRREKTKGNEDDPVLRNPWDCFVKPTRKREWKDKGNEEVAVGARVEWGTYPDFPTPGAHLRRDEMYARMLAKDHDNVLQDALDRLLSVWDGPRVYPPPPDKEDFGACARQKELYRKARAIVKLLWADQRLKAVRPLPKDIVCGSLRSKVRSIYDSELTVAQELSIKTSMKVEAQPCDACEDRQVSPLVEWKKARLQPESVDQRHLEQFKRAFARNVPDGWDAGKEHVCFVPNGHATNECTRREGGNWNRQEFSREPSVQLVYSAGKPRVVTLYSSFNTEVLKPLHDRLYSVLKRKGWLLVGSPTREKLTRLRDGTAGPNWLSFDYSSATDKIKLAYVRAMIDVLKQKSVGLSEDEINCLDVVGDLRVDCESAESGQPMGSLMSFPLLCLVNKTVVDMALTRLLVSGKIRFKEWTGHRCLINGDDLLTRDVSSGGLVEAIEVEGAQVGLVVNKDKTMVDPEYGEINSTVFKNCVEEKKTNVSSLWMGSDVVDVMGFAREATKTPRGFRSVVLANVSRLARSKTKTVHRLPGDLIAQVLASKRLKHAISARPASEGPQLTNLFPVVPLPDGYDLSRRDEVVVLHREVDRARDLGLWHGLNAQKKKAINIRKEIKAIPGERLPGRKIWKLLQPKKTSPVKTTLSCFAREWEKQRKEALLADDAGDDPLMIVSDLSGIERMLDTIRYMKTKEMGVRAVEAPVQLDEDFVSLRAAEESSWISNPVMGCDNVASRYVCP